MTTPPEDATLAVATQSLGKQYDETTALDDVHVAVPAGATYGLVGPNGAGKSTLLGILAGLRVATSGTVQIRAPRARIAVLPDTPQWDPWLTAFEVVDLARVLSAPHLPVDRVTAALATAGLEAEAGRRCGGFSRGMLQRLGLAATLVSEPELVLLDEPSSALDPVGRRDVLELIRSLHGTATVIFSSHILGDVQEICDTVGILHRGRLIAQGPLGELLSGRASSSVAVTVGSIGEVVTLSAALTEIDWVTDLQVHDTTVTMASTDLAASRRELPSILAAAQVSVTSVVPMDVTLEQVFLEMTR